MKDAMHGETSQYCAFNDKFPCEINAFKAFNAEMGAFKSINSIYLWNLYFPN